MNTQYELLRISFSIEFILLQESLHIKHKFNSDMLSIINEKIIARENIPSYHAIALMKRIDNCLLDRNLFIDK